MRFAAIDIGSNAVRLLFSNVFLSDGTVTFKKESLIRIPLRLGEEAFTDGSISEHKVAKLLKTMEAFMDLMDVAEVISYRACATAAMREAANGSEIVALIKDTLGLEIDIIDGSREAEIIYANHIEETLESDRAYLYVDVGGGSTEFSLLAEGKVLRSRSFPIGTLKILNEQVNEGVWDDIRQFLKPIKTMKKRVLGIGSGGNINKLYKLYGNVGLSNISLRQIKGAYKDLKAYTYVDRVTKLGLKPDRADVIIPAAEIFLFVMKNAGINKFIVPKIGLSDGIVHNLYEEHKAMHGDTVETE